VALSVCLPVPYTLKRTLPSLIHQQAEQPPLERFSEDVYGAMSGGAVTVPPMLVVRHSETLEAEVVGRVAKASR